MCLLNTVTLKSNINMKYTKRTRTVLLVSMLCFVATGCMISEKDYHNGQTNSAFTRDEAKSVFENSVLTSNSDIACGLFGIMEFTPQWDQALFSEGQNECLFYRVPIHADKVFKATIARYQDGRSSATTVVLNQRLVVIKNKQTDFACCYLESDIPSRHREGKKKYSGLRIYSEIATGNVMAVYQYHNGRILDGVFLPRDKSKKTAKEYLHTLLKGIILFSESPLITRSDEWDFTDQDYYDLGGGFFLGDDGYIYYDTNGSGGPDSLWIDPSVVSGGDASEPTEPNDPDYPFDPGDGDNPEGDPNPEGSGGYSGGNEEGGSNNGSSSGEPSGGFQTDPWDIRVSLPDTLNNISIQIKNGCTMTATEHASRILGHVYSEGDLALYCWGAFGHTPYGEGTANGLSFIEYDTLIRHFFEISNVGLEQTIQSGNIGIAIISSIAGGHAVVVIGYNNHNGSLIVLDPEIGSVKRVYLQTVEYVWPLLYVKIVND